MADTLSNGIVVLIYQPTPLNLEGNAVYFAAFKKHIGFYPTSTGIEKFKNA
jgi:uncharacterized protein YdhG (YjbR/CyaY superfamily)